MKAIILAAGEGTRLKPLTNVRPKPMLPVGNRPILEYVVEAVAEAGINEIVLVVGYKRERIQNHFGDGDDWNVEITYVAQEPQLGTGHAVLQAKQQVGGSFVVLNGDKIVTSRAIKAVIDKRQRTGQWVMAVTRSADTELYGVVSVENGHAVDIAEKPPSTRISSDFVNAGIYGFGPEIFSAIQATNAEGELGLPTVLNHHREDHPVTVVRYDGEWFDVTRPWDLLTVNGHAIDQADPDVSAQTAIHKTATVVPATACSEGVSIGPNATVLRGTALGDNVSIGANAVVENAVIMSDVTIDHGATIRDCIVGANATIGPEILVEGGTTDMEVADTIHRDVRFGGIIGDNAVLGGRVTMTPGTRLGNDSEVQSGTILQGQLEPGSLVRRG